jgi:hypothetical protein
VVGGSELLANRNEEALQPLRKEGAAMSVDEAVAYALKEPEAEGS